MKVTSFLYKNNSFITDKNKDNVDFNKAQLVFGFGSKDLISKEQVYVEIKNKFPNAEIALCSSAGEIFGVEVFDDTISLVSIEFSNTEIKTAQVSIEDYTSSFEAGKSLKEKFSSTDLKLVFVLSDGGKVNGSELVKGLNEARGHDVVITGGLAGDGTKFESTVVGLNEVPKSGKILAVGFYGSKIQVSHGSLGGWEGFGLKRTVTKSIGNVLYKIDGENALSLYKTYLGKYADELPSSALLFPLSIKVNENESIVRTILSIDEENQTMTFAGDIPEGSEVRFMKANFDKLIDAAGQVASVCMQSNESPKVAFLISCVGRKIILGNRIDEEVEAVSEIFGENTILTGFYSYGEISPLLPNVNCELHNQTMTITTLDELE